MSKPLSGFVDLHTHTNASDGSYTPQALVEEASRLGLDALAITDHETFAGFEQALPFAAEAGLELLRGIELNSRCDLAGRTRYVHVLAYFPNAPRSDFKNWLATQQSERRDRNVRLIGNLQERGIDIQLEEVEKLGRSVAGRPHFARVLVSKGYAQSPDDAFQRFIGEDAPSFVERQSPGTDEIVRIVRAGGGIPVLAHPVRIGISDDSMQRDFFQQMHEAGLLALETIHSDQSAPVQRYYSGVAHDLRLLETGGSDFHGTIKPDVALGTGRNGNVRVPRSVLDALFER